MSAAHIPYIQETTLHDSLLLNRENPFRLNEVTQTDFLYSHLLAEYKCSRDFVIPYHLLCSFLGDQRLRSRHDLVGE